MNLIVTNEVKENANSDSFELVEEKQIKPKGWGVRHTQCVLLFFTTTLAYVVKGSMGVALVAMVQRDKQFIQNVTFNNETQLIANKSQIPTSTDDFKMDGFFNMLLITPPFPTLDWSKKTQDLIMASFFWGYMFLQIPAGQLSHWFGVKRLLLWCLTSNCIISLIFPAAAYYGGWTCAVLCRISQGLGQACIIPGIHSILGRWAPLEERGRLAIMIYGGQSFGIVLGLPLTAFIASSIIGWPGIFYTYSFMSGALAILLRFMLANAPAEHKTIAKDERRYIEEALGQRNYKKRLPIPWKKILTSRGMLAILLSHIGFTWGQLTLMAELPAYMDQIMGVNLKANGLLAALPFIVKWLAGFFFSWLTDMIMIKKYLSVTHTRKLANSIGYFLPCIGMVTLAYVPPNIYVAETLLVLVCCFKSASQVGFYVNHVDISPNFAGTMMSVSNFVGNLVGSMAPVVAGRILVDSTDPHLWSEVFLITAGFYFVCNTMYLIFGTSVIADWNEPPFYEKVALDEKNNCKDESTDLERQNL